MTKNYDVVVIGAGSGGLTSAVGFSKLGKKVLLVEKEHMGGECTNSGCVPSKALLHAAKAGMSGIESFNYVREIVDDILEEETPAVFETMGIDVVLGEAEFVSRCAIKVGGTEYEYKTAIIATGSSPRMTDIDGLDERYILTNQNLFQLKDAPEKLLIVGGGPIGLEMAQAFALLGSDVTVVERAGEMARLEDPEIRKIIRQKFDELGINVITDAAVTNVEGATANITTKKDETHKVEFDNVLIAIGRVPNLPPGLEAAGITFDEHHIHVDSQWRTSNKYVYALGDVAQRLKFTHIADDIARQVVTRVASKGLLRVNKKKAVPKVTYTTPEIAQVGMLEAEAVEKYGPDRIMRIDVPYTQNDRAKTDEQTTGHLTVTVRRLNGALLGANIIGPAAGELIAIFTLAIDHKISLWKLRRSIYAYPTYSLVVKKAGDQFFARQLTDLKQDMFGLIKRNATKLVAGLLWLVGLLALSRYQATHDITTTQVAFRLFDFIAMTAWGPLLYILFYTIRPITFFPATILTILSGIFFGFLWGTTLTVIAATLSAAVAYAIGRFFGANLKLEDTAIGNWIEALRRNTFETVLTARLVFLPFDLISYAAGILRTSFTPFVLATFFGIILGTATFVSIGASLDVEEFKMDGLSFNALEPQFLALSAGIFVVSLLLSRLLKRWKSGV